MATYNAATGERVDSNKKCPKCGEIANLSSHSHKIRDMETGDEFDAWRTGWVCRKCWIFFCDDCAKNYKRDEPDAK